jgi:hypothetical protein
MDAEENKELIRQLAYRWTLAELPDVGFSYADQINVIAGLLRETADAALTESIFTAVLNQAIALGRGSIWVERELRFEGLADAPSVKAPAC